MLICIIRVYAFFYIEMYKLRTQVLSVAWLRVSRSYYYNDLYVQIPQPLPVQASKPQVILC